MMTKLNSPRTVDPPAIQDTGHQGPPPTGEQFREVFTGKFIAGDLATRRVLAKVMGGLVSAGVSDDDLATVELILAEALNNVVEHAYADGPGQVEMSVALQSCGLACMITDNGRPMPTDDAPDPPLPPIEPPANIPEGGFGWHIIRCLTRDLEYRRDGVQNHLSMTVPLMKQF